MDISQLLLCRIAPKQKSARAMNWRNQYVRADGRYLRVQIEEYLREHPKGATRAGIAKALKVSKGQVSPRMDQLVRDRVIEAIDTEFFTSHGQHYQRAVYALK